MSLEICKFGWGEDVLRVVINVTHDGAEKGIVRFVQKSEHKDAVPVGVEFVDGVDGTTEHVRVARDVLCSNSKCCVYINSASALRVFVYGYLEVEGARDVVRRRSPGFSGYH